MALHTLRVHIQGKLSEYFFSNMFLANDYKPIFSIWNLNVKQKYFLSINLNISPIFWFVYKIQCYGDLLKAKSPSYCLLYISNLQEKLHKEFLLNPLKKTF